MKHTYCVKFISQLWHYHDAHSVEGLHPKYCTNMTCNDFACLALFDQQWVFVQVKPREMTLWLESITW